MGAGRMKTRAGVQRELTRLLAATTHDEPYNIAFMMGAWQAFEWVLGKNVLRASDCLIKGQRPERRKRPRP